MSISRAKGLNDLLLTLKPLMHGHCGFVFEIALKYRLQIWFGDNVKAYDSE